MESHTSCNDLPRHEGRYQKMIEEVEDYAIFLLSVEGIIETWNRGAEKIKGYRADEIIGRSFESFYPPADRESGLPGKLLAEARKNGRVTHEGWRIRKDGTAFWGSIVITALHGEGGALIGFSKVTRDLTERKMAESRLQQSAGELQRVNEELRRSEERYHKMIEEVEDYAILLLSVEGMIQNWNRGAEKIKGYRADEIIGRSFEVFYPPADLESGLPGKLLAEARENGRAIHEGWRIRKDGTAFWGSIVITALHGEGGALIGFSKVTRDLTERKMAEDRLRLYAEQLESRNIELEQFAYVASHDLREPLRKIVAFGDRLASGRSNLDDRSRDYVGRMQQASQRMMSLIDDLLVFSRIGTENVQFVPTDLNTLVAEMLNDIEETIQRKQAVVKIAPLPTLPVQPTYIRQLFQNLFSNALKFNDKETPAIEVTCEYVPQPDEHHMRGRYYRMQVCDNGIGFDPQFTDRIFNVFERLHGRLDYEGTGIGLAICKKIVDVHHGTIQASSREGEGSVFTITLPAETTNMQEAESTTVA